jgi:hypothetical protein
MKTRRSRTRPRDRLEPVVHLLAAPPDIRVVGVEVDVLVLAVDAAEAQLLAGGLADLGEAAHLRLAGVDDQPVDPDHAEGAQGGEAERAERLADAVPAGLLADHQPQVVVELAGPGAPARGGLLGDHLLVVAPRPRPS